jgi:hypothetical protein
MTSLVGRIWSYVSPVKPAKKREDTFKTPAIPPHRSAGGIRKKDRRASEIPAQRRVGSARRRSMTPTTKLRHWKVPAQAGLPPPSPINIRPTVGYSGDLEDDTLVEEPEESSHAAEYDANDDTIVVTEDQLDQAPAFDIAAERKKWAEKAEQQRAEGWSEHSIQIYRMIGMRGHEPLMPTKWMIDFPTLPDELFTDDEEAVIRSVQGQDFRGTLFTLNSRIASSPSN